MSDLTVTEAQALRNELDELKRRVTEIEDRLTTRISAVEHAFGQFMKEIRQLVAAVSTEVSDQKRGIGGLSLDIRANNMAQIHLWGVLARNLNIDDEVVTKATAKAERILKPRKASRD